MKLNTQHLFLLAILVALIVLAAIWIQSFAYPIATPEAVQLLNELNNFDDHELFLHNNSEITIENNYVASGESNAFIYSTLDKLTEIAHPVEWNNRTRSYQFKSKRLK